MPKTLLNYRIFIASPSGLEEERNLFRDVIQDYNESDANQRGVHFTPVGWEATLGAVGRPQSLINQEVKTCDYFILLLHDRWGSSPFENEVGEHTSGTEEEFKVALDCYTNVDHQMAGIVLFFKAVSDRQLSDPGDQLNKVLNFKRERENRKDMLFHSYDTPEIFCDLFRRHLAKWVRDHELKNRKENHVTAIAPSNQSIFFHKIRRACYFDSETEQLLNEAEKNAEEGKIVEAEICFSKIAVKLDDPWAMSRYGRFLRKIGQCSRARTILEEAINLANSISDIQTKAYATRQMARLFENEGNFIKSEDLFRQAIANYELIRDMEGKARTLRDLSQLLRKRGMLDDSKHELESAQKIYFEINHEKGLAATLGYLGLVYRSMGDLKKAEQYHLESLKLNQKIGNEEAIAIVHGNLGVVLRQQGRLDEAQKMHQNALNIHKKLGKLQGISRELSNLGTVLKYLGKYDESRKCHIESLSLSEQLGNKHGIAIQLSCLGQLDRIQNNLESAEQYHRKSLAISETMSEKRSIAIQYKNLAAIYRLKNDKKKAKEAIEKALEIDEKYRFKYGIAQCKVELSKILINKSEFEQAKLFLQEARAMLFEAGAERMLRDVEIGIIALENNDQNELNLFLISGSEPLHSQGRS